MKLEIKLLSDMCTYSGETYNSLVDMDVVYDQNGIPYIPAKRIKGCIREAALEMQEMDLISREQYEELFGKEGNHRSAFSLSNAYLKDYAAIMSVVGKYQGTDLVNPQNLLEQYTDIRVQTAVDLETGVADKNSLRTMRVIRKGLEFEAECSLKREDEQILRAAVSLVKHMGVSRSRGLGLVRMELKKEDNQKAKHVLVKKEQSGARNKIGYRITLKSTMVCKSPQGNQAETQDYIAGSKVLGLLAGALGDSEYRGLMEQHEIMVSNAYIMNDRKRCLPARVSLQKEKDQSFDADGSMMIKDMLYDPDVSGRQMTPAGISYMDAENHVANVITEISYHHQRPMDKSVGHATGLDGSSFYQLCGISPGQSFGGYIYADRDAAEKIMDAMSTVGSIRMGYGKSSEFGVVDFVLDSVTSVEASESMMHDAIVTLGSDVILYNENGMPSTELRVLRTYLEQILSVGDLEITHPFLEFSLIGGYNVTWQRRKPAFYALGKGSVFWLHSDTGFNAERLRTQFIGERTSEGYGELIVEEPMKTSDFCIHKQGLSNKVNMHETNREQDVMKQLLQAEFERRTEPYIRYTLKKQGSFLKNEKNINAVIAKLRIIFKNETSYEAMQKQVEGIEDAEKKRVSGQILELVVPENVESVISQAIEQDYRITFENQWDESKLFKKVYRTYLTELKYFAKALEKRG